MAQRNLERLEGRYFGDSALEPEARLLHEFLDGLKVGTRLFCVGGAGQEFFKYGDGVRQFFLVQQARPEI